MIPQEIWNGYSDIIRSMFNFLNGTINKFNICNLQIEYYSLDGTLGCMHYPNTVIVYLGEILNDYSSRTVDSIYSTILLVLCHELFHTEQPVNSSLYNDKYIDIEKNIDQAASMWIMQNKKILEALYRFNFVVDKFIENRFNPVLGNYQSCTIMNYYKDILAYIVVKNSSISDSISEEIINNKYKEILISLKVGNIINNVVIKYDGNFISDTRAFNTLVNTISFYEKYSIDIDLFESSNSLTIIFKISNQSLNPMEIKGIN